METSQVLLDEARFWQYRMSHEKQLDREELMNSSNIFRTALCTLLLTTIAIAGDSSASAYEKGTITQQFSAKHKSYDVKGGTNGYQINNCADFQNGQVVEYRVQDKNLYIHREDGKEYKCAIEAELAGLGSSTDADSAPALPKYQKGTIEGYETRRDTRVFGGGGGGGAPGSPVSSSTRYAKVYELHGADLIYKIDYCGRFQAGQFTPGQVVEYRVDGSRLYILHDNNKEYSCQVEGTRKPEDAKPAEAGAQSGGPSPAPATPAAAPTASTAKLSITSVPDGADIEVDGNFSGNTPSDLEIPEGEHSITVKKSGYKNWERKMKVVAGSSIHLNAEMEKTTNP